MEGRYGISKCRGVPQPLQCIGHGQAEVWNCILDYIRIFCGHQNMKASRDKNSGAEVRLESCIQFWVPQLKKYIEAGTCPKEGSRNLGVEAKSGEERMKELGRFSLVRG